MTSSSKALILAVWYLNFPVGQLKSCAFEVVQHPIESELLLPFFYATLMSLEFTV